jgi:hypothetical protein
MECYACKVSDNLCECCGDLCTTCCTCVTCKGYRCTVCIQHKESPCSCCKDYCTYCCTCDWCNGEECETCTAHSAIPPCDCCHMCLDCCECEWCSACNVCSAPHSILVCECTVCDNCERRTLLDDICTQCQLRCTRCCGGSGSSCAGRSYAHHTRVETRLEWVGKPSDRLWLGVELELEAKTNRLHIINYVNNVVPTWIMCKQDSSLTNGIELVTAPSILSHHQKMWPIILTPELIRLVHRERTERNAGLHIHISRKPVTPLTVGKMLVALNTMATPLYTLCGRYPNWAAEQRQKTLTSSLQCTNRRYEILNVTNINTLEFRLPVAKTDVHHVLTCIEFFHCFVHWAREASMRKLSWEDFRTFALAPEHRKTYRHLVTYFMEELEYVRCNS